MSNCEHYESHVSAWIDDQLDRAQQVEMLDHFVRCRACRQFYVESRALDGLVAAVRTPADEPLPSTEVWKAVEEATGATRPRRLVPAWAMKVAAVLVVAIGLGVVFFGEPGTELAPPQQAEVLIDAADSDMTAFRFVELTKEVLRSDPEYHNAMLQIMEKVVRDTGAFEASNEGIREPESTELTEIERAGRLPA